MQYTQSQIDQCLADYMQSNGDAIKERLCFLLDNYNPENDDYLSSPDIHYCFEEARHAFMMGDFVASIIMCAVTIERHLARLLGLPYYNPVDEKMSLEGVGERGKGLSLVEKFFDPVKSDLEYKIKPTLPPSGSTSNLSFAKILYGIRCEYAHKGNYLGKIFKIDEDKIEYLLFDFKINNKYFCGECSLTYKEFINIYMEALVENIKTFSGYVKKIINK